MLRALTARLARRLLPCTPAPPCLSSKALPPAPGMQARLLSLYRRNALALRHPTAATRPPLTCPPARALCVASASPGGGKSTPPASRRPEQKPAVKGAMEAAAGEAPAAKKQRLEHGRAAATAIAAPAPAAGQAAEAQPRAQEGEGGQPAGKGQRKKKKEYSPEMQARHDIQMAAKAGDIAAALAVYDRCRADKLRLPADSFSTLLYLCSLGENWEAHMPTSRGAGAAPAAAAGAAAAAAAAAASGAANGAAEAAPAAAAAAAAPSAAEVMARGRQIFEELREGGKGISEMCYTALARMAAIAGDPEGAFQVVKDMQAAGFAPKLRSFTPALAGFAEQGRFERAAEVDAAIAACSLDLTEAEYARLMQAAAASASWEQGRGVLRRMGRELTTLRRDTLDHCAAFFCSERAQRAFGPGDEKAQQQQQQQEQQQQQQQNKAGLHWAVGDCQVMPDGAVVPAAAEGEPQPAPLPSRMQPIDLDPEEWVAFRDGIAALAARSERRPNEFTKFLEWLGRKGPFGAVVDAANVALYGQNFAEGGFTFGQIRAVRARLLQAHPDLKPLVILHNGRTRAPPAQEPAAQALLEEMRAAGQFFSTPTGSNDDWYWIYAAVAAGDRGLLVSNDEMRDHIFQLLAPKFFMKWKQRHQVKYRFSAGGALQFEYPPPFTTCVQELACGSWVLPAAEGPWLLARRVPLLAAEAAAAPAAAQ